MAKDYAKGFYSSRAWKQTQAAYMESRHYVCERCGGMARIVHHICYITPGNIQNPEITLNWDNLEALCMECHNQEHMGSRSRAVFDADGNMIALRADRREPEYEFCRTNSR